MQLENDFEFLGNYKPQFKNKRQAKVGQLLHLTEISSNDAAAV